MKQATAFDRKMLNVRKYGLIADGHMPPGKSKCSHCFDDGGRARKRKIQVLADSKIDQTLHYSFGD